ncbi:MAG TPA: hypothetical protein VK464_03345 [Symbiobacteriaceae bacterium]|jgi:hypothetical protein|nr:hypothetical protein [Symbiobacteriaceae bacterium]
MAKGGKLTQKDIMIWTMEHPNGTKTYYVIEKEPFETEGVKKSVHRVGSTGDAVFRYRDQAEAEIAKFPPGEEPAAGEQPAQEA